MFTFLMMGLGIVIIGTFGWIKTGIFIFVAVQILGIIIALESLLFISKIHSHWNKLQYIWHLIKIFILGVIVGVLIFDVAGIFLFRLWEYPYHSPAVNLFRYAGVIFAWGLYFLIFHESYLLLYKLLHKRHRHLATSKLNGLFSFLGIAGIILISIGASFNNLQPQYVPALISFAGIWLILEGFQFPRKHRTLLADLISGNFRPLIAITIGAVIVGFLSEYSNIASPIHYWIYHNVPLPQLAVSGVSIFLLLSWSTMYVIFLSIENILFRSDEILWD